MNIVLLSLPHNSLLLIHYFLVVPLIAVHLSQILKCFIIWVCVNITPKGKNISNSLWEVRVINWILLELYWKIFKTVPSLPRSGRPIKVRYCNTQENCKTPCEQALRPPLSSPVSIFVCLKVCVVSESLSAKHWDTFFSITICQGWLNLTVLRLVLD